MNVVEKFSTISHKTIIMTTASFPPVDDLINNLSQIEYKKHFHNLIDVFIIVTATVAAVVSFIYTKTTQWYQEGGKDLIREKYQKIKDFLVICYLWIRCEGYPELMKFVDDIKQTYRAWRDLVTVH